MVRKLYYLSIHIDRHRLWLRNHHPIWGLGCPRPRSGVCLTQPEDRVKNSVPRAGLNHPWLRSEQTLSDFQGDSKGIIIPIWVVPTKRSTSTAMKPKWPCPGISSTGIDLLFKVCGRICYLHELLLRVKLLLRVNLDMCIVITGILQHCQHYKQNSRLPELLKRMTIRALQQWRKGVLICLKQN